MLAAAGGVTACDDATLSIVGPDTGIPTESPAAFARQARPIVNDDLVPLPFFVRDESGNPIDTSDPAEPIHDAVLLEPLTAPDGHTLTWVEWSAVKGRVSVKCTRKGTHSVLHLTGLVPGGVYTVWNVTFEAPGFTGEFVVPGSIPANVVGFGPAGPSDGSRSAFRASASGRGSISTHTPAGPLGSVGEIGACALTDEFEWHVVGLYHADGRSYGPVRGPEGTRAEQFAFIFR